MAYAAENRHKDAAKYFVKAKDKKRAAEAYEKSEEPLKAAELYMKMREYEIAGRLFLEGGKAGKAAKARAKQSDSKPE